MFTDTAQAKVIEEAEARLTRAVGRIIEATSPICPSAVRIEELGSGVAVSSGTSSPFDKVIGLGFETLDTIRFEHFEREVLALGRGIQVELSTLADPALARWLTGRGFQLSGFENVLGLRVEAARDPGRPATGISIEEVSEADSAAWIDTVIAAFLQPDTYDGPAPPEEFGRDVLEPVLRRLGQVAGLVRFLARRGGQLAGAASMRLDGGVAQLTGAGTLVEHRRHGVQSALLGERLVRAARAGCELAVVTTAPGSKSQQNVMRAGFSLLYARAILIKTG